MQDCSNSIAIALEILQSCTEPSLHIFLTGGCCHWLRWYWLTLHVTLSLGDAGGYMGLLIGASCLTLCEVLDLFLYNCALKLVDQYKRRKTAPMPDSNEKKHTVDDTHKSFAGRDIRHAWMPQVVNWHPDWISNNIHYKVWDGITCPFPNFNGATVEVWEWINILIPSFTGYVITYPCRD